MTSDADRERLAAQHELCSECGGNGVLKIHHGVKMCPRCGGECYEPSAPPATRLALADLRVRAEALWEELGGDLCICQRPDVPHWCEKCQGRLDLIESAFIRALSALPAAPAEGTELADAEVDAAIDALAEKALRSVHGTSGHAWGAETLIRRQAELLKKALRPADPASKGAQTREHES